MRFRFESATCGRRLGASVVMLLLESERQISVILDNGLSRWRADGRA